MAAMPASPLDRHSLDTPRASLDVAARHSHFPPILSMPSRLARPRALRAVVISLLSIPSAIACTSAPPAQAAPAQAATSTPAGAVAPVPSDRRLDSLGTRSAVPASGATAVNELVADTTKEKTKGKAKSASPTDTVKKPAPRGSLGPASGERHLSFRDTGSDLDSLWPPKMPAPLPGSILPAKRVIAFYGNPLSKRMGILGEFESDEMLRRLDRETAEWNRLDPAHPVQPALHLIAVVAQASPGRDGKYRLRMDSTTIEKVYGWARSRNALLFVDLQVGKSRLQDELPWIERFLMRPDVHLGIDPEFSMKNGGLPGKKIGTFDASDLNYASHFLAGLVDKYKLPPKILVVHRFTRKGVTNTPNIRLDPRVQLVMDMDGFGAPWLKRDSYYAYIKKEPVQFAGWKQFTKTKNDNPATSKEAILRLWPVPIYVQYQ